MLWSGRNRTGFQVTLECREPEVRTSLRHAPDANFGFKSGTPRIGLLVALSIPKFVRARRKSLRTSGSGHQDEIDGQASGGRNPGAPLRQDALRAVKRAA